MRFLLILPILLIYGSTKAQFNVLKKSPEEIKTILLNTQGYSLSKTSYTDEGSLYLAFSTPDIRVLSLVYYFDKSNKSCDGYKVISDLKYMPDAIRTLNDIGIKTEDKTWLTKNMDLKMTLEYQDKSQVFSIYYTSLK